MDLVYNRRSSPLVSFLVKEFKPVAEPFSQKKQRINPNPSDFKEINILKTIRTYARELWSHMELQ